MDGVVSVQCVHDVGQKLRLEHQNTKCNQNNHDTLIRYSKFHHFLFKIQRDLKKGK